MDVPSKPVGYEYVFVDKVPEDYFCNQCKHVAREPNITSCCGETFCRACVEATIEDKEPCPNCESNDVKALGLQVKYSRSIQSLRVHCSLKDCGCEWTGQLQHLDAHLDLTTGDCVYVDVDCPRQCNQKVQKRNVDTHLANHCPNRDYTCPHCSFKATFREVTEHFQICRFHPLVCPNRCGASFERDVLENHLSTCSLQKVQCEFSYAGCTVEFIRDHQKEHMEQSTHKHLFLVAAASKRMHRTFDQKLQEQQREFEQKLEDKESEIKVTVSNETLQLVSEQKQQSEDQVQALKQTLEEQQKLFEKKLEEQREEFHRVLEEKLAEKDRQIQSLAEEHGSAINSLRMEVGVPPYEFTLTNYSELKAESAEFDAPTMYTHADGYRFRLKVWPNGMWSGHLSYVSVKAYSVECSHDDILKFPAEFTITLELLNQHSDKDHYSKELVCKSVKNTTGSGIGEIWQFVPHASLEWNDVHGTQYLLNDCLKFRVAAIQHD